MVCTVMFKKEIRQRSYPVYIYWGVSASAKILPETLRDHNSCSCASLFDCMCAGHPPYIVDPSFQAQFHLGRNDDTYCSFLSTVPPLFVGTSDALEELVNLCAVSGSVRTRHLVQLSVLCAAPVCGHEECPVHTQYTCNGFLCTLCRAYLWALRVP
eukprot:1150275-Pelagomonas_calceolata.AAC.4